MQNFLRKNWVDLIFLVLFLLSALALFSIELSSIGPVSDREQRLFNIIEFVLAIGIGWVFQRLASREEFQKSLKQYGLSAYRRINDIDKSVVRLNNEIGRMRLTYPKDKVHELDLLRSITHGMKDTVQSSISDWSDIIGEEVRKVERIEELQKERISLEAQLSPSVSPALIRSASPSSSPSSSPSPSPSANETEVNQRLQELEQEIEELRSEIPFVLQYDLQNNMESLPREGRLSEIVLAHFATEIYSHSCITLTFTPFVDDENAIINGPYKITPDISMFTLYAGISNKDNVTIGRIDNTFPEVYDNDYIFTVLSLISVITGISNGIDEELPLQSGYFVEGATIENHPFSGSNQKLFKIPATADDVARG